MKLILIGEDHLTDLGPLFLLSVLQVIKKNNQHCRVALEVPSKEQIDEFLSFGNISRKTLLHQALSLYEFFPADLAYLEHNETREEIMAYEIIKQYERDESFVIVMLVGALHLPGLQQTIKNLNRDIDILSFAPKIPMVSFFPRIYEHIIQEKGFFYTDTTANIMHVSIKINRFIQNDSFQSAIKNQKSTQLL